MADRLHEQTLRKLATMLRTTLGLGAVFGAAACASESDTAGCPQTDRHADRVCYDPAENPAASTGTSGEGTAGPGGTSTGSGASTTSAGTAGTGFLGTTTGGDNPCAAFENGPRDMPGSTWSGPVYEDGRCCFTRDADTDTSSDDDDGAETGGFDSVCGRPFRVGVETRLAFAVDRDDWAEAVEPNILGIDEPTRAALVQAWLADAAAEHASVASFARFALELLAVGAPPDLLVETHRAMADEIGHARACYGLASAYAGRALGPGPLATHDGIHHPVNLARVAAAAVHEGCVGETLAALQATVAASRTEDPAVRVILEGIAEDEARHAALAWRFVSWAIARGHEGVRSAVERAFTTSRPRPSRAGPDLSRYGQLGEPERIELCRRGLDDLVHPLARSLLETRGDPSPPGLSSVISVGDDAADDRLVGGFVM